MTTLILAWVVTYVLHSTILVLGAWLLDLRWRDRPERMSAVWKTALCGGVLTATVQTGLGVVPLAGHWALNAEPAVETTPAAEVSPILATEPPMLVEAEATPAFPEASASAVVVHASSWPPPEVMALPSWPPPDGPLLPATIADDASPSPAVLGATTAEPVVPPTEGSPWWAGLAPWLVGVLVLGAGLGLGSVLLAFVALRRQLQGRRRLTSGSLSASLTQLQRAAGLDRAVPLTLAPKVRVPMAVGVLNPEIVVPPQAMAGLSSAHQQTLLAHELAHVLRRDPTWRVIALLVERVLFVQPLNRLASARLAQTAEYLCDDWAARHTQQPLALASCLTEIAAWVARPGPVVATMSGPRSILGRRVHRLLQPASERTRPWWWAAAMLVPLAGLVVAAPGITAQARTNDDTRSVSAVVVIDDDGVRHEHSLASDDVVVWSDDEGEQVVVIAEAREADQRPRDRKAAREVRKARRTAKKELRKAFREARRRDEAAPSRRELEAILRRAHRAEPRPGREAHGFEGMELRVVVPGEFEVHGRLPIEPEVLEELQQLGPVLEQLGPMLEIEDLEDLETLKKLEQLEQLGPVLEQLEGLELEQLGPVLEQLEGLEQVRVHPSPPADSTARDRARYERLRAEQEHQRRAAHAQHRRLQERQWEAAHEHQERQRQAARARYRRLQERQREAAHEHQERQRREVERARRHERLERRHRPEPAAAPEPPLVMRVPSSRWPERVRVVVPAPPAPPTPPASSRPRAPRVAPAAPPVVWVSAPEPPAPPAPSSNHT